MPGKLISYSRAQAQPRLEASHPAGTILGQTLVTDDELAAQVDPHRIAGREGQVNPRRSQRYALLMSSQLNRWADATAAVGTGKSSIFGCTFLYRSKPYSDSDILLRFKPYI